MYGQRPGVTITLDAVQLSECVRIKATFWSTANGRYGSQAVVTMDRPGDDMPSDPEALLVLALDALHAAVYHS